MIVNPETLPQEYKEIYDNLIMPVDTNIDLDRVILSDENKEMIAAFIKETEYRDKLYAAGLEPMNRLLLYGASGTGKTFMTKALSNKLQYTMLYIDIAKALTESTVSMNISDIFKLANYIGECIIFFDECDSIAWNRDAGTAEGGTIRRAVNSIFQHLDQMNTTNIFVAATNMLNRLDPAFERRFSMKMGFRRPNIDIKDAIKHFIFPKFRVIDNVDPTTMDIIARRTANNTKLSYYELQGIVERGMKRAVLSDTYDVFTQDIYNDLALAMNIKLRFQTQSDPAEIFESSIK